jgi:putative transcriptional regulator
MPVKQAFWAQRYLAAALLVMLLASCSAPTTSAAGAPAKSAARSAPAPASALTSILIVAQEVVADPNFGGSIVVVMNNIGPAPVGIIINRPMPLTVSRFFPKLKRLAQVNDKVYFGGPVEFGTVWYLFRAKTAPANAIRVCDGVYVGSDEKLLFQLLSRPNPMQGLRIFIGHAGWAPGQLQAEIQGGAWAPRRANAGSIFNPEPLLPWPSARGPKRGT